MRTNCSVMFDIKFYDNMNKYAGHPYVDDFGRVIIETITNSGFPNDKVYEFIVVGFFVKIKSYVKL